MITELIPLCDFLKFCVSRVKKRRREKEGKEKSKRKEKE